MYVYTEITSVSSVKLSLLGSEDHISPTGPFHWHSIVNRELTQRSRILMEVIAILCITHALSSKEVLRPHTTVPVVPLIIPSRTSFGSSGNVPRGALTRLTHIAMQFKSERERRNRTSPSDTGAVQGDYAFESPILSLDPDPII